MATMPVPLRGCPKSPPKPSPICAAVCLSIAASYNRRSISAPVSSFLPEDLSPEHLSRIKAAVLPAIEEAVARATRRGRPPREVSESEHVSSTASLEALLEVAASILAELPVRERILQDRLVETAERLRREHGISFKTFALKLGIPGRTLRYWRKRTRPPEQPGDLPRETDPVTSETGKPTEEEPAPGSSAPTPASSNHGRFSLEVIPPGLQVMADTTDICAFGVNLKLVGAQDAGNRHRSLLESFSVSETESAEIVLDVISRAFPDPSGTQAIVDQGTPYMAKATREALEKLEIEHCPQKEATPTDKAPLERAWRTIKAALEPLLRLTNRVAESAPQLRDTALARTTAKLLVGTFLRVYASARASLPHPLEARDPVALIALVEETKERARAEHRSRKLLLEDIHARYSMPGSRVAFVRAHRRAALEDVKEAERRLRDRACRCRTRACDRYFAGILSKVSEEARGRRALERRHKHEARLRSRLALRWEAHTLSLAASPEKRLAEGLSMIACHWKDGVLLFGGKGLGTAHVERAVQDFFERGPLFWKDDIRAAWHRWVAAARPPTAALPAIDRLLEAAIAKIDGRAAPQHLPVNPAQAIFRRKARSTNGPPPTHPRLRI